MKCEDDAGRIEWHFPFNQDTGIGFAFKTDKGPVRPANEDRVLVVAPGSNPDGYDLDTCGYMFAVADGVGGHQAGDLASRMACEGLVGYFNRPTSRDASAILREVESLFQEINRAVFQKSVSANEFFGMGTTLSTLVLVNKTALIIHVGDSRVYRLRKGHLERLSDDHTEVQALIDRGELKPEEAASHPRGHYLTECMGLDHILEQLFSRIEAVEDDDIFLLSSDGLTDVVKDTEIEEILLNTTSCHEACEALLQTAFDRGTTDNVTVIVVRT